MKELVEVEIQNLKKGNIDALDEIYKLTSRGVYLLVFSILRNGELAKDIMQNTFVQVAKNIEKYNNNTNPIAWITVIARNLAYREYSKKQKTVSLEVLGESISDKKDFLEVFVENSILDMAMKILDTIEREIVILFAIEGYKHREIAKIVDKPMGTVQWIYNKAIKKLRRFMEDEK